MDARFRAELIGTAALILIGCGAITIGGFPEEFPIGILPVALAFGLTVMAMAYAIGPVSGCHINPAVTAAMWAAGRIKGGDAIAYIVAQLIGGVVGAAILVLILKGKMSGYNVGGGLGQTGWGP
ncbi:MAG: aquaporin, partial [Proteobacteria bacterium]|nr:aquaporin [Pseudomonadota bacterium]